MKLLIRGLLLAIGICLPLAAGEMYARTKDRGVVITDDYIEKATFKNLAIEDIKKRYVIDPEFGFRPTLGDEGDSGYSEYGTQRNHYDIEKPPGVTRILFAGDSVTRRGLIVQALQELYGEEGYEYWNGGVGSFGTTQELNYFKRFTWQVDPDQVVLQFHVNDFVTTPITMMGSDGRPVVYEPTKPRKPIPMPGLYQSSALYRFVIDNVVGIDYDDRAIEDEIRDSLREFRDTCAEREIGFCVVVNPMFLPKDEWEDEWTQRHEAVLGILTELEIRHFDLAPAVFKAILDGKEVKELDGKGKPTDFRHPSMDCARYIAAFLAINGLFEFPDGANPGAQHNAAD